MTDILIDTPAQRFRDLGGGVFAPEVVLASPQAISLLENTTTGTPVVAVPAGSYIWSIVGTFGGGTATLEALGPDGVTWVEVASVTGAGQTGVVVGQDATLRVRLTGGAPTGLHSSLS